MDLIEDLKIVSNRTHLTQEHVDRAFKEKSENLSSLLAQKTSVKLVSSHVIKAEGKQRTRAGCNSSAEDQAEVEDKAEQAEWPQSGGRIHKSPKRLLALGVLAEVHDATQRFDQVDASLCEVARQCPGHDRRDSDPGTEE